MEVVIGVWGLQDDFAQHDKQAMPDVNTYSIIL